MSNATYSAIVTNETAGENLSGHRVLRVNGGVALYATSAVAAHGQKVIGVSKNAAITGANVRVVRQGFISEPSWSWTPGAAIYCGVSGVLTQTPPTSGFVRQVAIAETATRIFVDLCPPIFLIGS